MEQPVFPTTRGVIFALVVTFAVLAVYATLQWLEIPAGHLIDWGIGIAGFWWLLGIVTIPWNVYFGARGVKQELRDSQQREISIRADDLLYVEETSRRALGAAVALHGLTALGFGALAWFGLTPVGWFGAAAAVALTLLRPAARLYRHVVSTLGRISARARYPRNDVVSLKALVHELQHRVDEIERDLDRGDRNSWAHGVQTRVESLRAEHRALVQSNAEEHQRLSREAKRAAEQVAEDTQFLGNVREIIRFVKHS